MARLAAQDVDHVWLDATGLERFAERFPTIAAALAEAGLDPARDWLPVAPAAHYLCGGIVADLAGATSLPGLWVAGEAACNGVHGANRLASNSLLDGMVYGPRVVEAVSAGVAGPGPTGAMRAVLEGGEPGGVPGRILPRVLSAETVAMATVSADKTRVGAARSALQQAMTTHAGVLRSAASLAEAAAAAGRAASAAGEGAGAPAAELRNLATVAAALAAAALARTETRGAHARTDFPEAEPRQRVRYVVGARPAG
jgi:L-aspartate oxidase